MNYYIKKKDIFLFAFGLILVISGVLIYSNQEKMSTNLGNSNNSDLTEETPSSSAIYKVFWGKNGSAISNIPQTESHDPKVCSDGDGGAIIVWYDNRTDDDKIYAQRVDKNGVQKWGTNGTVICNQNDNQLDPEICSDGNGGAIIAWRDNRGINADIYAQRIDKDGHIKWGASGTVICNETSVKSYLQICEDGNDGAIIAWKDIRTGKHGFYAQNINYTGDNRWRNNGTVISNSTNNKFDLMLVGDDQGNGYFSWEEDISGDFNIYAQKIDSTGNSVWRKNGTIACNNTANQFNPHLCIDGEGGAIITWDDVRDWNCYVQHINSTGHSLWGEGNDYNGTKVSINEEGTTPDICSDGSGGAIITWQFLDNDIGEYDIHAQKIDKNGNLKWGDIGIVISNDSGDQEVPFICSDMFGGAIISWTNKSADPLKFDIYAQHITATKTTMWGGNGTVVCNALYDQGEGMDISSDELGGALFAWGDYRVDDVRHEDIYAQRIGYPPSITRFLPSADDDDDDDDEPAIPGINPIILIIPICCGIGITYVLIRKRIKS